MLLRLSDRAMLRTALCENRFVESATVVNNLLHGSDLEFHFCMDYLLILADNREIEKYGVFCCNESVNQEGADANRVNNMWTTEVVCFG